MGLDERPNIPALNKAYPRGRRGILDEGLRFVLAPFLESWAGKTSILKSRSDHEARRQRMTEKFNFGLCLVLGELTRLGNGGRL